MAFWTSWVTPVTSALICPSPLNVLRTYFISCHSFYFNNILFLTNLTFPWSSMNLSLHLIILPPIIHHPVIHLSLHPSIIQSSICPSIHPSSICLHLSSICLSIHPSTCPSLHLSIHPFIHPWYKVAWDTNTDCDKLLVLMHDNGNYVIISGFSHISSTNLMVRRTGQSLT